MNEINNQIFLGRLGKDPELRYTKNQKPVCTLSVAITDDVQKLTIWSRVVVWGKQAENCKLYLKKGREVFVQGHKEWKQFVDVDGEIRKYEEVIAGCVGFVYV